MALKNGQIRIVQSSMLGSILSNILLVLGCCFFAGGWKFQVQNFNSTMASTMSSLMAVASASLIIPATLYAVMAQSPDIKDNILVLSHGTAIILLIIYVLYLDFQLRTHNDLFEEESGATPDDEGNKEEDAPILTPWAAGVALVVVTIAVAVCAEYLVDSIGSLVETAHISETFIGLILIPIVGNAAEHVTAVVVSMKDKMDLAIGVAIGSSLQIALLVTPFLVILGWIIGQPMTLHFETFETIVFFLSVLVVNYLVGYSRLPVCITYSQLIITSRSKTESLTTSKEPCYSERESSPSANIRSRDSANPSRYMIIALAFFVYPDNAGGNGEKVPKLF